MRLKIPGQLGRTYGMVSACQWPRSIYVRQGRKGAAVTYGLDDSKNLIEVRDYLAKNPSAKIWEVSMCCNLGDKHAGRLVRRAKAEAKV